MANTWGELSWSTGSWGEQNDVSVSLTGQQVNCAQNNVGISGEINEGWGRLTYGENAWGIAGDLLVTGIGLDVGIGTGSVTIDVQPELSGEQLNIGLNSPPLSFGFINFVTLTLLVSITKSLAF